MGDFEVVVPDGYVVVETNLVVTSENTYAFTHFLKSTAESHADHLNKQRVGPLLRYVVEPSSKALRRRAGWMSRWVVVPYQNVLRKKEN